MVVVTAPGRSLLAAPAGTRRDDDRLRGTQGRAAAMRPLPRLAGRTRVNTGCDRDDRGEVRGAFVDVPLQGGLRQNDKPPSSTPGGPSLLLRRFSS